MSKTIFYSWQSDLSGKTNNFFIRDCLKKALKQINKEAEIELSLDKDTQDTTGSPDIVDTILRKIRASDIFVCDVSIVNQKNFVQRMANKRKMPNPNVLIELGYAVKTLGWDRVICVVNNGVCKVDDLPFDIRNNRVSTYSLKSTGDKKKAEKQLVDTFSTALRSILDNYEDILAAFNIDDNLSHDKQLFRQFDEKCSQTQLFDSIDFLVNHLKTNDAYYRIWHNVAEFNDSIDTNFLNADIQAKFEVLAAHVGQINHLAALKLFSIVTPGQKYAAEYEMQGVEITPELQFEIDQTTRYSFPDGPHDNDWDGYHKRMHDYQDELLAVNKLVKQSYTEFRMAVKRNLYI
ncbi:MAG: hypothetical protein EOO90_06475 [Pedobacter sp.]|nr:MAG: hypothetical protein EOO90_06475 [Pedobacter sp.]